MRLATTTGDLQRLCSSHAEAVRAFEGSGFKHIDLNLYRDALPSGLFLRDNWMDGIKEVSRAGEALGFDFVQSHAPSINTMSPGFDMDFGVKVMEHTVETCAYLGIPCTVFHTGFRPDVTYPDGRAAYYEENFAFIRRLFPVLERTGVNLLIENTCTKNMGTQYFPITGEDMKDFVQTLNHPNVHCCWDTGHANIQGIDQYHDILTMGDDLCAVHVHDNHGITDDHNIPLTGTTDFDAILRGLIDAGFRGCFTFECDHLFNPLNSWPNYRRQLFTDGSAKLTDVTLPLLRQAQALLYALGCHMLASYGIPVE